MSFSSNVFHRSSGLKHLPFLFLGAPHFPECVPELDPIALLRRCISHLLIAISHYQLGPGELLKS